MPLTVADYRARVRSVLQHGVDATTWGDEMIAAGLRQALFYAGANLPPVETTWVCTAGREQDISSVAGLLSVAAVGWPWDDDEGVFRPVRWRWVGAGLLHIESGVPPGGDGLRLRYWRMLTISGLDGAMLTTVADAWLDPLATGAAAYALLARLRQTGEHPATPHEALGTYRQVIAAWLQQFTDAVQQRAGASPGPAWGEVGL